MLRSEQKINARQESGEYLRDCPFDAGYEIQSHFRVRRMVSRICFQYSEIIRGTAEVCAMGWFHKIKKFLEWYELPGSGAV